MEYAANIPLLPKPMVHTMTPQFWTMLIQCTMSCLTSVHIQLCGCSGCAASHEAA